MVIWFRIQSMLYMIIRKIIFLLVVLFSVLSVSAQQDTVFMKYNKNSWSEENINYEVDTVLFDTPLARHILYGTTIISGSANQRLAMEFGLGFERLVHSDCKEESKDFNGHLQKLNTVLLTDTSIVIDFNVIANCCHDFLCDIAVDDNGVLNLITMGYGGYCFCTCCFGLTYHLSLEQWADIPKVKSVIINNDPSTLTAFKIN